MTRECSWCGRDFVPRDTGTPCYYQLISAGLMVCWDCSDLFDEANVKLHQDHLICGIDEYNQLFTQNGYVLPLTLTDWKQPRTPWGKAYAHVVDSYGKQWLARAKPQYVTLKPIGA